MHVFDDVRSVDLPVLWMSITITTAVMSQEKEITLSTFIDYNKECLKQL